MFRVAVVLVDQFQIVRSLIWWECTFS
jgi:hypothetical protein